MRINKDNYELFFINYFDGMLKPEEIDALMNFLKANPSLEDEFYSFQNMTLPKNDNISFGNTDFLKKSVADKPVINEQNIDEFLIAYIEKDLNQNDEERLMHFLDKNPKYQKDLEAYKNTVSMPDIHITLKDKKSLKKQIKGKEIKLKQFYYSVAVAAATIFFFLNIFLKDNIQENNTALRIAKKDYVLESRLFNPLLNNNADNNKDVQTFEKTDAKNDNINSTFSEKENNFNKMAFIQASPLNNPKMYAAPVVENRNEYSDIYEYIKISEYNQGVEDYADILPDKPKDSFIKYAFNKLIAPNSKDNNDNQNTNPALWQIIDVGTYGINSLANNNLIEINRHTSENNTKTDFALGGNVIYSRTSSEK